MNAGECKWMHIHADYCIWMQMFIGECRWIHISENNADEVKQAQIYADECKWRKKKCKSILMNAKEYRWIQMTTD